MHLSTFNTLAILAIAPLIAAQSNCTVFTWDEQPSYLVYIAPQRISGGSTCTAAANASHECPITASGDLPVRFYQNLTLPFQNVAWNTKTGVENFLHSLILPAVNGSLAGTPWNETVIGAIDTTQALQPGQSGYINFAPLTRCFVGTMSNCTGELEDGLIVEACAPVYHTLGSQSKAILDGNFSVVYAANATSYRDPFSGQVSGSEGAGSVVRVGTGILGISFFAAVTFATLF